MRRRPARDLASTGPDVPYELAIGARVDTWASAAHLAAIELAATPRARRDAEDHAMYSAWRTYHAARRAWVAEHNISRAQERQLIPGGRPYWGDAP